MKTNTSIALAICMAALAANSAFATTGTWTGSSGATWDIYAGNWSGVTGAPWDATNGPNNTAQFTNSGDVTVSGAVRVKNILSTATSGTVAISGGDQLWVNYGDISVATGGTLSITSPFVAGPDVIGGAGAGYSGTVTLGGTPVYYGGSGIYVVNGTLKLVSGTAIGNANSILIEGYGTSSALELSGGITVSSGNSLLAGGAGLNSTGQLTVKDGTTNTWAGAIRANGLTTIGVSGAANGRLNLTGNITQLNSPVLQLMSQASNSTISVTGTITLDSSSTLRILAASGSGGVTRLGSTGNTLGLLKVDVGGSLVADVANAFDSAAVLQLGSAGDAVTVNGAVALNGYSQTVGGLRSGGSAAGETLSGGTRSITSASAATLTVNQTTSALYDGTITGAVALTKQGAGTLSLSGNNTFTGNTTISAGTLSANATNSLGGTARVTVTTGGTLLLSSNATGLVKDSAAVVLNGGKVQIAGTVSGLQETMGALTLGANSTIDFGTGGTLANFNRLTLGQVTSWTTGATLNIWNWTGTPRTAGGTDRLLVSDQTGWSANNLSKINFFSDGGSTLIGGGGAMFVGLEIVAVPEPSTWIAMAALVLTGGMMAVRRRHRKAMETNIM